MDLKENQVIEVEYDEEMIKEDLQALEEDKQELLEQDTFNTDTIEDLTGEGCEINEYSENN